MFNFSQKSLVPLFHQSLHLQEVVSRSTCTCLSAMVSSLTFSRVLPDTLEISSLCSFCSLTYFLQKQKQQFWVRTAITYPILLNMNNCREWQLLLEIWIWSGEYEVKKCFVVMLQASWNHHVFLVLNQVTVYGPFWRLCVMNQTTLDLYFQWQLHRPLDFIVMIVSGTI